MKYLQVKIKAKFYKILWIKIYLAKIVLIYKKPNIFSFFLLSSYLFLKYYKVKGI
jgi:hypothetical protein